MKDLLETLKTQHHALTKTAGELAAAAQQGDEVALQESLTRLRTMLEAHVALEDARFYPDLARLADERGSENDKTLARLFQKNMETIAEGVFAFFRRFDGKPKPKAEFGPALATALDVLGTRIRDEERTLHTMVRRLLATAAR